MTLWDHYDGPFDPDFTLDRLSRAALARLGREYMMAAHIHDRAIMPLMGVDPNRMVVTTMLLSGAIAGLIGMSDLFGYFHAYTLDFPTGLGFDGIAVALVGLNHPAGIAVGALLFGWVDRAAQILDLEGIPKEVIVITKGVIILSVVVAYEVVRRIVQTAEVRAAAEETRRLEREREAVPA